MKLRCQLFAIALLLTTSVTGLGGLSIEQKREWLRMVRPDAFRRIRLTRLDRAYLDVRTLLSQQGSCSEFFGRGPAQDVLEELVIKLREERLSDSSIGIRMSGPFTLFENSEKGFSYRLFDIYVLKKDVQFCIMSIVYV